MTEKRSGEDPALSGDLEFLWKILENTEESLAVLDYTGQIFLTNKAFQKTFGFKKDNYQNHNVCELLIPRDRPKLQKKILRCQTRLKKESDITLIAQVKNGIVDICGSLTPLSHNDRLFLLFSIKDISSLIKEEERIKTLERLATIGTFASGIVHEFNNVLTGIRGYSQLAKEGLSNRELISKAFDIIESESRRGADLCRNMSLYSSRTKITPEPTCLTELIDTVLSLHEKFFLKGNICIVRNYMEVPVINMDRSQIHQVLHNLIINACHAILPKGSGTININLRELKNDIVIEIMDTGIGIESWNISRIFDPFFTSKGAIGLNISGREIKGSGLGLSVSNSIIKKHKGTLTVKSVVDEGSCFTVKLPKIIPHQMQIKEKQREQVFHYLSSKPQRILVVDDESSIREMLFRALTEIQMDVTLAKNAEEAENLCKSYPFDIIFLDYILPEMNGDKLIPIIKEHLPQSKIIFISGWSSSPLKKKDLEKRVHAWIEKPFNIRQIFDCIQQLDHGSEIKH